MSRRNEIAQMLMQGMDRTKLPQVIIKWNGKKNGETEFRKYLPLEGKYTNSENLTCDDGYLTRVAKKGATVKVPYMKYYSTHQAMVVGIYSISIDRCYENNYRDWVEEEKIVFFKDTMEAYDTNGRLEEDGRYYNKLVLKMLEVILSPSKTAPYYKFILDEWNKMVNEPIKCAWYMLEGYRKLYPRKVNNQKNVAPKRKHKDALKVEYPSIYNKLIDCIYDTKIGVMFNCNFKQPGVRALEKAGGNVLDAIGFNREKAIEFEKIAEEKTVRWWDFEKINEQYEFVKSKGYKYSDYTRIFIDYILLHRNIYTVSNNDIINLIELNI